MARPGRIERIETLCGPPVTGRFYLVPVVEGEWCKVRAAWPVIGPKHADRDFFNFPHPHYHVDARFVSASLAARIDRDHLDTIALAVQRYPLSEAFNYGPPQSLSAPVWRRRRCVDPDPPYHHAAVAPIRSLNAAFAGRTAKRGRSAILHALRRRDRPLRRSCTHPPTGEGVTR